MKKLQKYVVFDYVGVFSKKIWNPQFHILRAGHVGIGIATQAPRLERADEAFFAMNGIEMGTDRIFLNAKKADPDFYTDCLIPCLNVNAEDIAFFDDGQSLPPATCDEDNIFVQAALKAGLKAMHFNPEKDTPQKVVKVLHRWNFLPT